MKTCIIVLLVLTSCLSRAEAQHRSEKFAAYLFTYFTSNGEGGEQIRFALSKDGLNYKALNQNDPIFLSKDISSTGGVRDPHILRSNDGKLFYMVATDMYVAKNGWGPNHAMVLMKSSDLIHWSSAVVNIPKTFPEFAEVNRVWAPQTIYDRETKKYMMYWSMRFGEGPDKIYYAYVNDDFTALTTTPKQLFFHPNEMACIDGDIVFLDNQYHLFFKTEGGEAGIKKATSKKVNEGFVMLDQYLDQTTESVEGAGLFKLNNSSTWILMYDVYRKGKYQFTKSNDLLNFSVVDNEVSMDFHPRHGTVMPLTQKEYDRLVAKWSKQ
ncbi:glycoside hydrolase family 43 protein [Pseudochryseolinea flava]|uniref:Arabinosidase n=1 Tax=Pseudochryseolinea flava TaxID=2059302 RepID=A0A364Y616_9BACT|nr:glycoside hydrolase family 43 protein [Pseudochryseolinea flava]RAW02428.1 arabinosidase [Pseudochryseolinea flava]